MESTWNHLAKCSTTVFTKFPQLSRFYNCTLQDSIWASEQQISSAEARKSCARCGQFFIPGLTCSVRTSRKRPKSFIDLTVVNEKTRLVNTVQYTCRGCHYVSLFNGISREQLRKYSRSDALVLQEPGVKPKGKTTSKKDLKKILTKNKDEKSRRESKYSLDDFLANNL